MKTKVISGVVILICGIVLLCVSIYIKTQVLEGREKISSAQSQVDQGNALFSLTPETNAVGKTVTGSAQRKIDAGSREAAHYEEVARWTQIGGIILIVVGAGVILISRKR
jgi:hypothetical protein